MKNRDKWLLVLLIALSIIVFILLQKVMSSEDTLVESKANYMASAKKYSELIHKHPTRYRKAMIVHYAYKLGDSLKVSPDLILAVILVESNFKIDAESNMQAYGLMQLRVPTARYYIADITARRLKTDWKANMLCGTLYLRDCINKHGTYRGVLVYNGGPRILKRYKNGHYINHKYWEKVASNL